MIEDETILQKLVRQGILPGMEEFIPRYMIEYDLDGGVVSLFYDNESIRARFEAFHEENPHVYEAIVEKVKQAWLMGFTKWSINAIFEILRWNAAMETGTDEQWKLSNDFRACYARKVMEDFPLWLGFFEIRELRSQNES